MAEHAVRLALVSPLEYLHREAKSSTRHEYVDGSICEMAGASRNHGFLTRSLHGMLYRSFTDGPCLNLDQDTKLWVAAKRAYYYPDAMIACPPNFVDEANGVVDNPTVVFEVLSPSTRSIDRGAKFADYRTLPTLRDYVLIDSEAHSVEVFSLESGEWTIRTFEEGAVVVPSVGISLELDEMYRHVTLN